MREEPSRLGVVFRFDFVEDDGPLYFANAIDWIAATSVADVWPALRAADHAVRAGYWVAGFLTYEAAAAFDPAFPVAGETWMPLAGFGVYRQPALPPTLPRSPYHVGPWVSGTNRGTYQTRRKTPSFNYGDIRRSPLGESSG